jgi:type VI secretion system protein ImpA
METPALLNFDELLAPIAGDNPAGIDLRADPSPTSLFFKIKDARSAARAAERGAEASGAPEEGGLLPPWRTILEISPKAIAGQSKDLEVAAWFCEALLRAHGVAGLRDGFRLATGLVENFWDQLYPLPDEDGIATRVAPITGLNGSESDGALIQPIRKVEISEGRDPGPFAFWQYEQAADLLKLGDPAKVKARIEGGAVTMEMVQTSVRNTPKQFYVTLYSDLDGCLAEYAKLCAALDKAAGRDSPPASNIRNVLQGLRDAITDLARDIIAEMTAAAAAAAAAAETGAGEGQPAATDGAATQAAAAPAAPPGAINTREDALRMLVKVAEYFRKNEPQSPVSYVIDDAVRRARMTLPELLAELIPDENARKLYFLTAGIRPPSA